MAEFDGFAGDYRALLDAQVGSALYFADAKAAFLARRFGRTFEGKVLDFGCGVGLVSAALQTRWPACRLTGLDPSTESLTLASDALPRPARLVCALEEAGAGFDLIVVSCVLHHIPRPDRAATIRSLAARLSPRGSLAVFEHNPANPLTRRVVATCPFDEGVELLWPGETRRWLQGAGLRRVDLSYISFVPPRLAPLRPLEALLTGLPLGGQYSMVGRFPAAGRGASAEKAGAGEAQ